MIELRWVERPLGGSGFISHYERVLQYRTAELVHEVGGARGEVFETWKQSEWKDVPVVEEEQTNDR